MKDIGNIFLGILGMLSIIIPYLLISVLLAWLLCDIDPSEYYSWFSGIWHGIFIVPNFIRHLFSDVPFKAEHYTTAYDVFYWIFSIMSILSTFASGKRNN